MIAENRIAEKRREWSKALEPLVRLGCDRGELLRLTKALLDALRVQLLTPPKLQSYFFSGMSRSAVDRLPARVRDFAEEIEGLHRLPISPALDNNPAAAELPGNLRAYARLVEMWRGEVRRACGSGGRASAVERAERALVSYVRQRGVNYSQGRTFSRFKEISEWLTFSASAFGIPESVTERRYGAPHALRQRLAAAAKRGDGRIRKEK